MWKLMIADCFHINHIGVQPSFYILFTSFYFNASLQMEDSGYRVIFLILLLMSLVSLFLSPIRIAKGLYLCPLTENDRKKYLKTAYFFRFVFLEVVFAITLITIRVVCHLEPFMLLLIFLCYSIEYLAALLLGGFYNPETVKKQYYIQKKLSLPVKKHLPDGKYQTPLNGISLLVIATILSGIGTFIPGFIDSYDNRCLFYYIPALTICLLCMVFYFLKYFDLFITINANQEMYSYTHKKKAGVFHAD